MTINRRSFLQSAAGATALAISRESHFAASNMADAANDLNLNLKKLITSPVKIAAIEVLRNGNDFFVRVTSTDGPSGLCIVKSRQYLFPLLKELVMPFFLGKDARDIETLVDGVYPYRSNYKMAGIALWNAVGWVEIAVMDLLGRLANKSVAELLGGAKRREVPIYVSSLRRDTTPEAEVEWVSKRLAETNAKAVKLKVGGRMSNNADALPGRSEKLIPLARKTFGDGITIYVDANSSYDAPKGIEVGRMLEDYGCAIFEEPCPFDEYEETKQVADALKKIKVAGGEQDTSLARWRWITRNRAVDVVQPDLHYNGGFIRAARVALLARGAGMEIAPHNPETGPREADFLQFVAWAPNLVGYQELHGEKSKQRVTWYEPLIEPQNGKFTIPTGPGIGITIDPDFIRKATAVTL